MDCCIGWISLIDIGVKQKKAHTKKYTLYDFIHKKLKNREIIIYTQFTLHSPA